MAKIPNGKIHGLRDVRVGRLDPETGEVVDVREIKFRVKLRIDFRSVWYWRPGGLSWHRTARREDWDD